MFEAGTLAPQPPLLFLQTQQANTLTNRHAQTHAPTHALPRSTQNPLESPLTTVRPEAPAAA